MQDFYDESSLRAGWADVLGGGVQTFHDSSMLHALVAGAVDGATVSFYDNSVLSVGTQNALGDTSGLNFYGNSTLRLNGNVITLSSIGFMAQGTIITNAPKSDSPETHGCESKKISSALHL